MKRILALLNQIKSELTEQERDISLKNERYHAEAGSILSRRDMLSRIEREVVKISIGESKLFKRFVVVGGDMLRTHQNTTMCCGINPLGFFDTIDEAEKCINDNFDEAGGIIVVVDMLNEDNCNKIYSDGAQKVKLEKKPDNNDV